MRRFSPFKGITGPAAVTVGSGRAPFVPPRCGGEDYSNVGEQLRTLISFCRSVGRQSKSVHVYTNIDAKLNTPQVFLF